MAYEIIIKSGMPKARALCRLVFEEVLPCLRLHKCYPAPVNLQEVREDPVLQQLEVLTSMRRDALAQARRVEQLAERQETMARRLEEHEALDDGLVTLLDVTAARVTSLERRLVAPHRIPMPTFTPGKSKDNTPRGNLHNDVKRFKARFPQYSYHDVWGFVYGGIYDQYHHDVRALRDDQNALGTSPRVNALDVIVGLQMCEVGREVLRQQTSLELARESTRVARGSDDSTALDARR